MPELHTRANIPALSSLLKQLQHLNNSDLRLRPLNPEEMWHREQREQWGHIKDGIREIQIHPEIQHYPELKSVFRKCQEALTKLRLYGSTDYQGEDQALVQNESVFNQIVDHIKTVYTREDIKYIQGTHGYSSEISRALREIVHDVILVGRPLQFIKYLELQTEPHWKANMTHEIENLQRDARAQGVQKLTALSEHLDTQFTQFIQRPTVPKIYNDMVASIQSFYYSQNYRALPWHTTRSLHTVVICLLCYGRKAGFKLSNVAKLDSWYWHCCNPHGYGTT